MADSVDVGANFSTRLQQIPPQGLGLSVDVYSPDLIELVDAIRRRGLSPGYLEIFKATTAALEAVRHQLSGIPLAYHGEGLWITQPESQGHPQFHHDVAEAAAHQNVLHSLWLNHECATKQMAGYSFGTYLPPLYTATSAAVVAEHVGLVQAALDDRCQRPDGTVPLFLLEMPPLTYFAVGTMPIPRFFRLITDLMPCGLVLDMGHLWTVYRYTAAWRNLSLEQFVQAFLEDFPLERVVEIHVAGLAWHEAVGERERQGDGLPEWIDAHAAPIPSVLYTMLEQVLRHPNLVNLRGLALEVDTKSIETIVDEFECTHRQYSSLMHQVMARDARDDGSAKPGPAAIPTLTLSDRRQLRDDYECYARIVSAQALPSGSEWQAVDHEGLERYRRAYLPHEILHWGGEIEQMFQETCRLLTQQHISLADFVPFWSREPRPISQSYDFFLLKIERFLEFVAERAPAARICAEREGTLLRLAYADANTVGGLAMEPQR